VRTTSVKARESIFLKKVKKIPGDVLLIKYSQEAPLFNLKKPPSLKVVMAKMFYRKKRYILR